MKVFVQLASFPGSPSFHAKIPHNYDFDLPKRVEGESLVHLGT